MDASVALKTEAVIHPLVKEAQRAFLRDFSEMLTINLREWVAYHGAMRIGFGRSKIGLYDECHRRGIDLREVIVQCVEPEMDVENMFVD